MMTRDSKGFLKEFQGIQPEEYASSPAMKRAMLVSPECFQVSSESAQDNLYMDTSKVIDAARAMEQHQRVRECIENLGVPVVNFAGLPGMDDAIYPNNAFATASGKLIVGHMFHRVRQQETKRADIRDYFTKDLGYTIEDLSTQPGIAELTGCLIVDRLRNVGFCGFSNRVDELGAQAMFNAFGLRAMLNFDLNPGEYHTNIVLSILSGRACLFYPGCCQDKSVGETLKDAYGSGYVEITENEKNLFVGNSLSITEKDVLFSQTALDAMRPETEKALRDMGLKLHGVVIDELEKGGGSLRCLIAEIF